MDDQKVEALFKDAQFLRNTDVQSSIKVFQEIVEMVATIENYTLNPPILKVYILSTGYIFTLTSLKQWNMAEESLSASEIYLGDYPMDYEVNSNYLLLSELTYKFEQSYRKALELLQYDKKLKLLALKFLSSPCYYDEGFITSSEYEEYKIEYQSLLVE